jgi:hypothetical protein
VRCASSNPHSPVYLTGAEKLPEPRLAHVELGEETQAVDYAAGAGQLSRSVPGGSPGSSPDPSRSGATRGVPREWCIPRDIARSGGRQRGQSRHRQRQSSRRIPVR